MSILAKYKISRLELASVAEQAGLSLTWWRTPEDRFSRDVAQLKTHGYLHGGGQSISSVPSLQSLW